MLTNNPLIHGPVGSLWFTSQPIDYYPLTYTSLWLEWRLWGLNPMGYHATNVLLHALSCIVLWRVFVRLNLPAAWLAALLFAIHPVTVESVAWIAERKNVLAMFFYSLTMWSFVRFAQSRQRRFYIVSIITFLLSLLAKSAVAPWPVVALGILYFTDKTPGQTLAARLRCVLPFFLIVAVLTPVTIWFQHHEVANSRHYYLPDFLTRMTAGGRMLWFYIGKALVPCFLTISYPLWNTTTSHSIVYLFSWAAFVCLLAVLWIYRKSWAKPILLALGYFVVLLGPVLGFFTIAHYRFSFVTDRWQYFALPAVTVLIAVALKKLKVQYIGGISLALLFVCLTFAQARLYRDPEMLWNDALRKNPSSWLAYNSLGYLRQAEGKFADAAELYQHSLTIHPEQTEAHSNLGDALLQMAKLDEAIDHLHQAIKIDPDYLVPYYNLGCALQQKGDLDRAVDAFREAIRRKADWADAHYNLGIALQRHGDAVNAESEYRAAIRYKPDLALAYNNLGALLCQSGRREEALVYLGRALTIQPDNSNALLNMGETLVEQRKPNEAIPHLQKAVASNPNNAKAHALLGNAFMALKQTSPAREHFEIALKLDPRQELALYGMASCVRRSGQTNEAVTLYKQLLADNPRHAEAHYQLALLLSAQQQYNAAIDHLREAVRIKPDWFDAVNALARYLATSPSTKPIDAAEAIRFAQRGVELTAGANAIALDTLGMAWARNEVFSKAAESASQALQLAVQNGNTQLVADIQKRLELYNKGVGYSK